jgi:hypothetical protein
VKLRVDTGSVGVAEIFQDGQRPLPRLTSRLQLTGTGVGVAEMV